VESRGWCKIAGEGDARALLQRGDELLECFVGDLFDLLRFRPCPCARAPAVEKEGQGAQRRPAQRTERVEAEVKRTNPSAPTAGRYPAGKRYTDMPV
jgi:hypothetical protein